MTEREAFAEGFNRAVMEKTAGFANEFLRASNYARLGRHKDMVRVLEDIGQQITRAKDPAAMGRQHVQEFSQHILAHKPGIRKLFKLQGAALDADMEPMMTAAMQHALSSKSLGKLLTGPASGKYISGLRAEGKPFVKLAKKMDKTSAASPGADDFFALVQKRYPRLLEQGASEAKAAAARAAAMPPKFKFKKPRGASGGGGGGGGGGGNGGGGVAAVGAAAGIGAGLLASRAGWSKNPRANKSR